MLIHMVGRLGALNSPGSWAKSWVFGVLLGQIGLALSDRAPFLAFPDPRLDQFAPDSKTVLCTFSCIGVIHSTRGMIRR